MPAIGIAEAGLTGGVIVAGADGTTGWSITTPGMYRACATATGDRIVAIYGDEA